MMVSRTEALQIPSDLAISIRTAEYICAGFEAAHGGLAQPV